MKKKTGILLFIAMAALVLTGWEKREVRLLDNSKLIDLSKAIELAKAGGETGDPENPPKESDEDARSETEDKSPADDGDTEAAVKNIVIRIRGEHIYYTLGNEKTEDISTEELEERLRLKLSPEAEITLMDDFAESHVYKGVCELLNELKNDTGIAYKEDQAGEVSDI